MKIDTILKEESCRFNVIRLAEILIMDKMRQAGLDRICFLMDGDQITAHIDTVNNCIHVTSENSYLFERDIAKLRRKLKVLEYLLDGKVDTDNYAEMRC
jgi:hypothetical protein